MVNKVIKETEAENDFVRDGIQPPTFPPLRAAQGPSGLLKLNGKFTIAALFAAALLATSGCQTPVDVTAEYGLPGTNITATVELGTNGATFGGDYQAGATNIGGSVTVGK